MPWRAIWSSMWSKKPMPEATWQRPRAIEIDLDPDLGFLGVALHRGAPCDRVVQSSRRFP